MAPVRANTVNRKHTRPAKNNRMIKATTVKKTQRNATRGTTANTVCKTHNKILNKYTRRVDSKTSRKPTCEDKSNIESNTSPETASDIARENADEANHHVPLEISQLRRNWSNADWQKFKLSKYIYNDSLVKKTAPGDALRLTASAFEDMKHQEHVRDVEKWHQIGKMLEKGDVARTPCFECERAHRECIMYSYEGLEKAGLKAPEQCANCVRLGSNICNGSRLWRFGAANIEDYWIDKKEWELEFEESEGGSTG